jgi:hypothetical protein
MNSDPHEAFVSPLSRYWNNTLPGFVRFGLFWAGDRLLRFLSEMAMNVINVHYLTKLFTLYLILLLMLT